MLTRRSLLAASGALLGALSGCSLNSFNLAMFGLANRRDTYLLGTLDVTTETTAKALTNMHLKFSETTRDGERVVFSGTTSRGNNFTLTLRRNVHEKGENTRMDLVWERDADDQFYLDLLEVTGCIHIPSGAL
jgi:hypothetical protein